MVKHKPWTRETLHATGGAEGVGLAFLEETFGSSTAPPEHRLHRRAVPHVLQAVLPEDDTTIRGSALLRRRQLLQASGYRDRPDDFDDLMRILDTETRLLTPVDPEAPVRRTPALGVETDQRYYQLTNDYLVPAVREWLKRKQKETWRGRAQLRLAERTSTWQAKPQRRLLPSWWEYLHIRCAAPQRGWTGPQRQMMAKAGTYHGVRAAFLLLLVALLATVGLWVHARTLVRGLLDADIAGVPGYIADVEATRFWSRGHLTRAYQATNDPHRRLRAALALLRIEGDRAKAKYVDYLIDRLLKVCADRVRRDSRRLADRSDHLPGRPAVVRRARRRRGRRQTVSSGVRFGLLCAGDSRWKNVADDTAAQLVSVDSLHLGIWTEALRHVRDRLIPTLAKIHGDVTRSETDRYTATSILADYASDRPKCLVELIRDADAKQYDTLFPLLSRTRTSRSGPWNTN